MSKKKNKKHHSKEITKKPEAAKVGDQEQVLDFEKAKDMTVEEAVKKQEEIEAGITEDDNLLDRYIKQHREEIEADKFETKQMNQLAEEVEQKLSEIEAKADEKAMVTSVAQAAPPTVEEDLAETKVLPVASETETTDAVSDEVEAKTTPEPEISSASNNQDPFDDFDDFDEEDEDLPFYKNKKLLAWLLGGLAVIAVSWLVYANFDSLTKINKPSSSSKSSASSSRPKTSSSSSSEQESAALKEFNSLYGAFFTDESQTALKNSNFDQLSALETALKALEGTEDHEEAKAKFDKLKAAIEATQSVNNQFDKPVLVDGEVDTSANVKPDANFTSAATGIQSVDADLTSAINFGRSQQEGGQATTSGTPAGGTTPSSGATTPAAPTAPAPSQPANNVTMGNGIVLNYAARIVYGSDQVNLQRDRSRVPYNDQVIADANNPAWQFAPGILEKIIATSNQRGYFSGNDFILEKVNIINGNGYYNLFKTDGTYLFSINAKTGYFVGNASGNSDAVDF